MRDVGDANSRIGPDVHMDVDASNSWSSPYLWVQMRLVELSGVLDFWDDPREDIYSKE